MLEVVKNPANGFWEVNVGGRQYMHWISGYCGRLFASVDGPPSYYAEMNDGSKVFEGTLDELRWMVGNYHRNSRFGTKPLKAELIKIAQANEIRSNMKNGYEYRTA